jgi:hypothetical protein
MYPPPHMTHPYIGAVNRCSDARHQATRASNVTNTALPVLLLQDAQGLSLNVTQCHPM